MTVPLLLIPGIASDAASWSGMPAGKVMVSDADSIAGMASDILARAPVRFALAGHSMGGYIALEMMRQSCERITRLALLSTSAAPDTEAQRTTRSGIISAAKDDYAGVVGLMLPALLQEGARNDLRLVEDMRAMLLRTGAKGFVRQQEATMARVDLRPMLPDIAVATLVLHGEDDRIVAPERSAEMARAIPHSILVMLKKCGHAPQRERPMETLAAMTAWLER